MFLEGRVSYEETSGTKGIIEPGGVEWMRAAGGVWHTAGAVGTARIKGYQLWIALTPEMESIESEAHYLGSEHFQSQGPASWPCSKSRTGLSNLKPLKARASSWARRSSIPTISCSAPTPYIRAGRHLTEAKQESEKSASGFGRKVVFRAIARLYQTEQLELALGQ
jgi:hypothetical protein